VNKKVFNERLKTVKEGDDVTADGKLFHIRAAATEKARSPSVERRVGGTTSAAVIADLRRRLPSKSATRWMSSARYDGAMPCRQRKTSRASLNK
jgi:hypothetical protein